MTDGIPLMQFRSHIEGKNAVVDIFSDRIEWERHRGVSGGKLTAGFLTGGISLAATGVRSGKAGSEIIPVKNISSVTTKRDGLLYTAIEVITTGNTIAFRVPHKDATAIKDLLKQLLLGSHPSQQQSAPRTTNPAPGSSGHSSGPDTIMELERLAALRDRGIITDDEFTAQKRRILGS